MPIPRYDGRSLPNVMASAAAALGHDPSTDLLPGLAPDLDPFKGRRARGPVVLVLVDGLGYGPLRSAARTFADGAAARWADRARPITSVFPTTTTVALTSLSTAAPPARHGVVGYRQHLPRAHAVVEVLRMSPLGDARENVLVGPEGPPSGFAGLGTIFRRGLATRTVSRDRFEASGFTRMIYDGAEYLAYSTFADLARTLRRALGAPEPPGLVLVYWDELDAALHVRGPDPELVALEVDRLDAMLAWVAHGLPSERAASTTVLLTADHGLVPAAPSHQLAVEREERLLGLLARPPAGDRRAAFLAARGGRTDELRELLPELLVDPARVLDVGKAIRAGLFGPSPHHPELAERIGDLLVLPEPPGGIGYRPPGSPPPRRVLGGAHGGLDGDELLVPLVAGPLLEIVATSDRRARSGPRASREKR